MRFRMLSDASIKAKLFMVETTTGRTFAAIAVTFVR